MSPTTLKTQTAIGVCVALLSIGVLAAQQPTTSAGRELRLRRAEGTLRPGDLAPDFDLKVQGGAQRVKLSAYRGKTPVALVFGSVT